MAKVIKNKDLSLNSDAIGLDHRLPPLLRRSWYSLNQAFRRRIVHLGITPNHYTILRWLTEAEDNGLTQRQIADLMASDPNTITSILNRMEAKKLIQRTPHTQDGRAHQIVIQPKGKIAFEKALPLAQKLQDEVMACLPKSQRQTFFEQLAKVADACIEGQQNSSD